MPLSPTEWTHYLHEHIPVCAAMKVVVSEANWDRATIQLPLADNLNHRDSAFGGSISTAGILVCWLLLTLRMRSLDFSPRVVVQTSQTDYLQPILQDFTATCTISDEAQWDKFLHSFDKKQRARLSLKSDISCADSLMAEQQGQFVAIGDGTHCQ